MNSYWFFRITDLYFVVGTVIIFPLELDPRVSMAAKTSRSICPICLKPMRNKKKGSKSRKEHINLPVWATEWRLIPKTRENGKIDRLYIHKEYEIKCRSLKEVKRYESQWKKELMTNKGKNKKMRGTEKQIKVTAEQVHRQHH
ncbi:hypothetical protein AAZX31_10G105500 [Glycine max]